MTRILLFATAITFSVVVGAQVGDPRRDVAVGITAGVSLNTVGFNPTVQQTMKVAPMAGLALRYTSEKYFKSYCGLQVELNWCNLGWTEAFDPVLQPGLYYKRDMHYLTLPIMARMGWGRDKRGFMGYIVAGPQLGYMLSSSESMNEMLAIPNKGLSDARKNQYGKRIENKFDYGITAGAGVELSTRTAGHFMLEARYYMGLGDFFHHGKMDHFGRSANSTIVAKFTYLFDILKTK